MSDWWHALGLAHQILYSVAFLATTVLFVQLVLGLLGFDHHHAVDISGGDHPSGLGIFSVQTLAAFFAGFGWGGIIWLNRGVGVFLALGAGTIVGAVFMTAMALLTRTLMRMQDSGTLDYANAVGATGTVYVPIPPARGLGGQVEVQIQDRTVFAEAVSDASDVLKTGATVRIVSLVGRTAFLVEPT